MELEFFKYHGTGNDFILFDNRQLILQKSDEDFLNKICDRHFGIGADGVILIQNHSITDFEMIYFNSNGREGSMCGNGGRCAVAFAKALGMIKSKTTKFQAIDGEHSAEFQNEMISLKMNDVIGIEKIDEMYFVNTGSPHLVWFREKIDQINIVEEGRKIRYNHRFKSEGVNINFVEQTEQGIYMRTYERGVEDETLSCGTGTVAVAIICMTTANDSLDKRTISVLALGGNLQVSLQRVSENSFTDIHLIGPAEMVFQGKWNK